MGCLMHGVMQGTIMTFNVTDWEGPRMPRDAEADPRSLEPRARRCYGTKRRLCEGPGQTSRPLWL